ncbi:type VI secretion system-associated protein TagO [Pseudidiomarina insulisalsae]|uniref:Uncharacterized protein n=1 Tax=Pseudidiomarina insulisalsae TaxID=575789 RepID=A0A432YQG0_9GAMM|nr:type VI secretion system-associated protein TagO [Pseudidiomarina insulisalsae]RUO63588.1 hypothetical protein CWI71_00550 [Pseudidiomarina insulisalsae]
MLKLLGLGSVVSCVTVALLWTPNASAQAPAADQLKACASIENPLQRLVCYDKLAAGQSVEAPAAQRSNTQPAAVSERPQRNPEDQFGLPETNDADDTIYVSLQKVEKDPYGKWIIYLTNGQVWKQTDSQTYQLPLDADYHIERGVLNGFFLGREGLNKRIKVRRIK